MRKSKKSNLNLPLILVMGVFVFGIISLVNTLVENNKQVTLSEPNYLGLAKLGIIPSKMQCSHSANSYYSTGVGMQDKIGNKYVILESKFGDESCLAKI